MSVALIFQKFVVPPLGGGKVCSTAFRRWRYNSEVLPAELGSYLIPDTEADYFSLTGILNSAINTAIK